MQHIDTVQLHTILTERYILSEIRQMCFHLGVDYENLEGNDKSGKALSLIMHMQRNERLDELAAYVYRTRPFITPEDLELHVKMGGDISYNFRKGDDSNGIRFEELEETAPPTKETAVSKDLRLDAAFPAQVQPDRSFMLAIAIRQSDSPKLQELGMDQTTSGDLSVEWADGANSVALRIHISAPDCDIEQDEYKFRFRKGKDSPNFYFQLTPKKTGPINILVTVYQEQEWVLGTTRLHTDVQELISGEVELRMQSHSIIINNYGDTYNFSGEFNGANVNVRSTLQDVNQTINSLPRANEAEKAELQRQIAQLNRVLQQAPPDKKEEADAVAKMADALIKNADSGSPNKMMLEITGDGLKQAAENLAGIVPDIVKIAGAIVAGILGLS